MRIPHSIRNKSIPLSRFAWNKSSPIITNIMKHPFLLGLIDGTLEWWRFCFYLEQDVMYLTDYARCLSAVSAKAPKEHQLSFSRYINPAVTAEQDEVLSYYDRNYSLIRTGKVAPATIQYSSMLLRSCLSESFEVSVAAILPCFWIYHHIGCVARSRRRVSGNVYNHCIDAYSSPGFTCGTHAMIRLFDHVADEANEEVRLRMLDAFERSASAEWFFFNDSYNGNACMNVDQLDLSVGW